MKEKITIDPQRFKVWVNEMSDYLNGGADSVYNCSMKFNEQLQKLVQPNVWTGPAAAENYRNFIDTHNHMVNFINDFAEILKNEIHNVSSKVSKLELTGLEVNSSMLNVFGSLNYNQLKTLSEENVNKSIISYDYNAIVSISESLKHILGDLDAVKNSLISRAEMINDGSGMWDGKLASNAKEILLGMLHTNIEKIMENLNICIDNIRMAADDAKNINLI